ncbi:hypothetical protein WN943_026616 [Citrus x changshan-huyou]
MLQLGTILNSKSFAITVADTRFTSPNPSNYPNFDFLLIVGGFISSNPSFGDLLASILFLYHNSKAPFQQCSTLLMEQQKARAEVISCIFHDKITYFSKAVSARSFQAAACALLVQLNIILAKLFLSRVYTAWSLAKSKQQPFLAGDLRLADCLVQVGLSYCPRVQRKRLHCEMSTTERCLGSSSFKGFLKPLWLYFNPGKYKRSSTALRARDLKEKVDTRMAKVVPPTTNGRSWRN